LRVVGKGDKPRVIPMHPTVVEVLASAAPIGFVLRDAALDKPYLPATVSRLGGKYLASLGFTNRNMHRLRHRFGSALLEAGVDITTVADLIGHENLNTTRGYALVPSARMRRAVDLLG
jgi:integrase/recombinase XerC